MDPRQLFFVDETGFEDFARRYGRSPSNYPLPSFASFDKTSVIGVVGFLGLVQAIRFDANAYRSSSLSPQFASMHNDDHLAQILAHLGKTTTIFL